MPSIFQQTFGRTPLGSRPKLAVRRETPPASAVSQGEVPAALRPEAGSPADMMSLATRVRDDLQELVTWVEFLPTEAEERRALLETAAEIAEEARRLHAAAAETPRSRTSEDLRRERLAEAIEAGRRAYLEEKAATEKDKEEEPEPR